MSQVGNWRLRRSLSSTFWGKWTAIGPTEAYFMSGFLEERGRATGWRPHAFGAKDRGYHAVGNAVKRILPIQPGGQEGCGRPIFPSASTAR